VRELIAQRRQAVAAEEAQIAALRQREAGAQAKIDAALEIALTSKTARERLDAKVAEIEAALEQTRREIRQAEARLALARVDIPAAEELAEACRRLSKGAEYADDQGRRDLFDAVQLQVWVKGDQFWADGILPGLRLEGTIATGRWVQHGSAVSCSSSPSSRC
jgi:chromosome segregation ATPase